MGIMIRFQARGTCGIESLLPRGSLPTQIKITITSMSMNPLVRFIPVASRHRNLLCHSRSFYSSSSAPPRHFKPKFPTPRYTGPSQPIPTSIIPIPSTQPLDPQINSINKHQHDIANTLRPFFESQSPLLLQNLLGACDAIYFWRSLEYWRVAVGEDTPVDVEIGKGYNRGGGRATMMFGEYLNYLALSVELEQREYEQYTQQDELEPTSQQKIGVHEVAYLAQNELFHQVKNDIAIPQFCEHGEYNVGEGKLYQAMIWMGPRHTVSPLHFDPLDNILMQVVGWKRVFLFPPDDNQTEGKRTIKPSWHYAGENGNQYNTSAVDIENPNHELFPHFGSSAPIPYECILGPGDGLFIPKRWWHHVRSLELSVSSNVWWR